MSTALTTTNNDDIALSMGIGDGSEPLRPVNLTLVQSNNFDELGAPAGSFLDTQSNMSFDSIQVVAFSFHDGKVLFKPGEKIMKGVKPLCRSNDAIRPVDSDEIVQQDGGRGCAKCPMNQWKVIGGKKIRPACGDTMSVILAEQDTGFLYRLNAKRGSIASMRALKDTWKKYYIKTKAQGKAVFPWAMSFKMSSLKITGEFKYYIPKFGPPCLVPQDRVDEMKDLYTQIVVNKNVSADAEAEALTETPDKAVDSALEGEYQIEQVEG